MIDYTWVLYTYIKVMYVYIEICATYVHTKTNTKYMQI